MCVYMCVCVCVCVCARVRARLLVTQSARKVRQMVSNEHKR